MIKEQDNVKPPHRKPPRTNHSKINNEKENDLEQLIVTNTTHMREKKPASREKMTAKRGLMNKEVGPAYLRPTSALANRTQGEVQKTLSRTNLLWPTQQSSTMKERKEMKEVPLHGQNRKVTASTDLVDQIAKLANHFKKVIIVSPDLTPSEETQNNLAPTQSGKDKRRLAPVPSEKTKQSLAPTESWKAKRNLSPVLSEKMKESLTPVPFKETQPSLTAIPSEETKKSTNPSEKSKQNLTPSEESKQSMTPNPTEKQSLTQSEETQMTSQGMLHCGLPNFQNNCYVNASLQCLFSAGTFCRELAILLENAGPNAGDTFYKCFVELSKVRCNPEVQCDVNTNSVLMTLIASAGKVNQEFTINKQNDAHEFLCCCLDQLEQSVKKMGCPKAVELKCPVKSNFKFKMRNVITCSSCGSQQNQVEMFNHISVPLTHDSVDQCLNHIFNNVTVLDRKCDECGGKTASSSWKILTLPRFLVLQLNRFEAMKQYVVKLTTKVDINPELQITCIPQPGIEKSNAKARSTDKTKQRRNRQESAMSDKCSSSYQLISCLSHCGRSPLSGHYVADCSTRNPQEWMTCNDRFVSLSEKTDLLMKRSTSAYVLLYERVDTG